MERASRLHAAMSIDNIWFAAALWMGLAFLASLISIRVGISVALIEILLGVAAGNFLGIEQTDAWMSFLAMLGSGVLTFLAGAEIDPASLRAHLKASMSIGIVSFALPFAAVWGVAELGLGWDRPAAQIAGIALSTTSVAVVYAVMIEGGLGETPLGKMLLAACFITDFGTVLALGILFAHFDIWLVVFVAVLSALLWYMPTWMRFLIARLGSHRVSEPDVKFIFLVLFFLGGLATTAKSEAVLPAYLVGLVVAGVFVRDKAVIHRVRTVAFTLLTPFYFMKAGLYVTLPALASGAGLIVLFLCLKMATKLAGTWPLCRHFSMHSREATFSSLLMATGLTFGTISALFGLQNGHIDQAQYSLLVTVVILSAFIPTLIAERLFRPTLAIMHSWGHTYSSRHRRGMAAAKAVPESTSTIKQD
jgi:Kef-type K+ transport system membrane component KefB